MLALAIAALIIGLVSSTPASRAAARKRLNGLGLWLYPLAALIVAGLLWRG
jgi:heme/copper-type cytochrome/quinol oxidase subunit 1